ncbi:MAG: conjugal transfer protein TraF [Elusimicrobia bacterium]|nr:conjugal transfer protein TraF [Elusimicrobiota bacterium]
MQKLSAAFLPLALAIPAAATPWHNMGPRAMGMGGAQVAVAQGPLASYWNPAGLGQLYNVSGVELPIGARGEFTGTVLQGANDINEIRKACEAGNAAVCTAARVNDALRRFNDPGNGVMADLGGGLSIKIKKVVVFANNLTYIGGSPKVDFRNTCNGATPNCLSAANNSSSIVLRGGNFTELGVGYGREIMETGLSLGVNLKGIIGRVGYQEINVATDESSFNKFKDNTKTSFQPGVDVGMLWDMRETFPSMPMRPRLGVVGRNVNAPEFKNPDVAVLAGERAKFPLNGQARAGFALSPFKWWHLALDADLTDNLTPVDGFKSRYMSAGTEINVFNRPWLNIPLRAGLQKNLSDSASGLTYTAGAGLNFVRVVIDVAGMVSAKTTSIQSEGKTEKVPNNFGAAARFAFLFGGTDEGRRQSAPRAPRTPRMPPPEPKKKKK